MSYNFTFTWYFSRHLILSIVVVVKTKINKDVYILRSFVTIETAYYYNHNMYTKIVGKIPTDMSEINKAPVDLFIKVNNNI